MTMRKMYPAVVNSPRTELTTAVTESQVDIPVTNVGVLLSGEGIATIGNGDTAETITYTSVEGNTLKGCVRGYQGIARAWTSGTRIARNFAAADWDAARENITELADRLDTPERSAITLQPGMQVVQADQEAPFSLTGLTGRTLVNLLGRDGNCESIARWLLFQGSAATDNTNKTEGMNGIKLTVTSGSFATATAVNTINAKANKFYIAIVDAKNGNATNASFYSNGLTATKGINTTTDATQFAPLWRAYAPTADVVASVIIQTNSSATSQYAYFDAVRFYEITAAEYAALDSMTPLQVAAKYPYVDSVQPVRNPYAIRYGENLLPPFYEWTKTGHTSSMTDQYGMNGTLIAAAIGSDAFASYNIDAIANQDYTLSNPIESTGYLRVSTYDGAGTRVQGIFVKPGESKTIKALASVTRMTVVASGVTAYTDEFDSSKWTWTEGTSRVFKNPMLNIGTTAKPFKPREDAMLALQTDLYADPSNGANADELFEKDGQYFKLKKWQNLVFDGSLGYTFGTTATGIKKVNLTLLQPGYGGASRSGFLTKYDGKLLNADSTVPVSDTFYLNSNGVAFTVAISGSDSGWGDSYTPTADEIKAYFMGWRMGENTSGFPLYNGSGQKWWARRNDQGTFVDGTGTLPTMQSPINSYWTPCQLLYQLATPVVEPITSEGQLTLIEGNNQVEVGTGMVTRESNKPGYVNGIYYFNDTYYGSPLKYKVDKVMAVYKNNVRDYKAVIYVGTNQYGNQKANLKAENYDPTATYSISYLMLDASPIASFVGSVPDNEKALLTDLVQDVQQANARLSVVESKKAEKDAPAWITPTLLNSWVNFGSVTTAAGYYKDSEGYVHLKGLIKSGVVEANIFILPEGYRPKERFNFGVLVNNSTANIIGQLKVDSTGTIVVVGGNALVSLDGIAFKVD